MQSGSIRGVLLRRIAPAGARKVWPSVSTPKLRARIGQALRIGNRWTKSIDIGAIGRPRKLAACQRYWWMPARVTVQSQHAALPEGRVGLSAHHDHRTIDRFPADAGRTISAPSLATGRFPHPIPRLGTRTTPATGWAARSGPEEREPRAGFAPKAAQPVSFWVNGSNMFDAAAPFGGMRESGFVVKGVGRLAGIYQTRAGPNHWRDHALGEEG